MGANGNGDLAWRPLQGDVFAQVVTGFGLQVANGRERGEHDGDVGFDRFLGVMEDRLDSQILWTSGTMLDQPAGSRGTDLNRLGRWS